MGILLFLPRVRRCDHPDTALHIIENNHHVENIYIPVAVHIGPLVSESSALRLVEHFIIVKNINIAILLAGPAGYISAK